MKTRAALGLFVSVASILGCSGSSTRETATFGDEDAGASPYNGSDAGAVDPGNGSFVDAGTPDPVVGEEVVYGHSPDTLYKLDPTTHAVTVVGQFSGCSQVVDIALDAKSNLYGTTNSALYLIDAKTAKCTFVANGSYPNSLSFVPKGTVDPNAEALVGYVGSNYVRIDTKTGSKSNIGSIGGGLTSSGDIVSVNGGRTFLTVKGNSCNDCIIEVNPSTGSLVKNLGSIKHTDVFGLAFWAGKAYGFDNTGELFEVTFGSSGVTTTPITIPGAPSDLQFWGAGSTTSAPLGPK